MEAIGHIRVVGRSLLLPLSSRMLLVMRGCLLGYLEMFVKETWETWASDVARGKRGLGEGAARVQSRYSIFQL